MKCQLQKWGSVFMMFELRLVIPPPNRTPDVFLGLSQLEEK